MPSVELSARFFKQELNNYSCFVTAIFRELVQNSVDAGCSTISVKITQEPGSKEAIIQFHDNGCGMNEDVLRNVYLKLGETTKTGENTIGGFGKARMLTCFAHNYYKIHTHNWICEGSGGHYEINLASSYMNGCLLEIHMEANSKYNDRIDVRAKLEEFLGRCQLPCKVFINDAPYTQWLYRRQVARELTFGNIHVNKSETNNANTLLVRVNGVLMYTKYTRANMQVVLEINQAKSRDILLSNRDSLHSQYERELDEFLAEVAVDTKSALKSKRKQWKQRFGSTCFVKRIKPKEIPKASLPKQEAAALFLAVGNSFNASVPSTQSTSGSSVPTDSGSTPIVHTGVGNFSPSHIEQQEIQKAIENMLISLDSENSKMIRAAKSFQQENWVDGGGNKKKLLAIWTVACSAVLDAYMENHPEDAISWLPGFVFSDDAAAMCDSQDNLHCLLLNPVNGDGKIVFKISKLEDRVKLISIAIHEVVHIKYTYHDESFAGECTDLTGKVFAKLPEILRKMRASI